MGISGEIQTGSLGLLIIFLGSMLITFVTRITAKCAIKKIEITSEGITMSCTGISKDQIEGILKKIRKLQGDSK
ncbi:MAG: hypothetical protein ABJN84_03575 [Flavobacteriaceae bacterium]